MVVNQQVGEHRIEPHAAAATQSGARPEVRQSQTDKKPDDHSVRKQSTGAGRKYSTICVRSQQTKSCGLFNSNAFESSFQNTSLLLSELTGRNPCGDTQASIRFKSFRESAIDVYTSIFP
jgi:hypothetical protein